MDYRTPQTHSECVIAHYVQMFFCSVILCNTLDIEKSYDSLKILNIYDRPSFEFLGTVRLQYFDKMFNDYKNGTYTRYFNINKPILTSRAFYLDREIKDELDLKHYLTENSIISKYLGVDLVNIEHKTRFGNIDILYKKNRQMLPCEVKLDYSSHDLITQIEKYIQDFWLYLHYDLFDTVLGITLSKRYSDFCLKELKKLDVIILQYELNNNNFIINTV